MRAFDIDASSELAPSGATRPSRAVPAVLRPARWLSLDVAAGALAGGALAAAVCGVRPPAVWWWLLPAATWVIYTLDRLLDVRDPARVPGFARHRFHRRHRRALGLVVALVAASCAVAATTLPGRALLLGSLLAIAAAGHLLLAQRPGTAVPKELSAALIYVAGIWLVPLALAPAPGLAAWALVVLHAFAALANLVAFALFELDGDRRDGRSSLARALGADRAIRLLAALTWLAALPATLALVATERTGVALAAGLLWGVALVPWVLRRSAARLGGAAVCRAIGDGAFLLLGLAWWLR